MKLAVLGDKTSSPPVSELDERYLQSVKPLEVLLISPHAPLGQQLQGQGPGDWVQVGQTRWQVLQAD